MTNWSKYPNEEFTHTLVLGLHYYPAAPVYLLNSYTSSIYTNIVNEPYEIGAVPFAATSLATTKTTTGGDATTTAAICHARNENSFTHTSLRNILCIFFRNYNI